MSDAPREIVIIGITESGAHFRPSDWAERLCGVLSLFGEDQRISYSPFVRPRLSGNVRCVAVDMQLVQINPAAFEFLLGFARDNELRVRHPEEDFSKLDPVSADANAQSAGNSEEDLDSKRGGGP
jgi:hypothetical protein